MSRQLLELSCNLNGELSCGNQYEALNRSLSRVDVLKHRYGVGEGFPAPGVGLPYEVSALKNRCNSFGLYGKEFVKAKVLDPLQQSGVEVKGFEFDRTAHPYSCVFVCRAWDKDVRLRIWTGRISVER